MTLKLELQEKSRKAKTLIVFIHGLGAPDTWNEWGKLVSNDEQFDEIDVALAKYQTGHFCIPTPIKGFVTIPFIKKTLALGQLVSIKMLAQMLEQELSKPDFCHYEKIVLVGHSMGGLISLWYMLQTIDKSMPNNIVGYISVATPFNGADAATIVKHIPGHRQIPELAPNSNFLEDLRVLWGKYKSDLTQLACFSFFYAEDDGVVMPASASSMADSRWHASILSGSHSGVLKLSEGTKTTAYVYVRERILQALSNPTIPLMLRTVENIKIVNEIRQRVFWGTPPKLNEFYVYRNKIVKKIMDSSLLGPVEVIGVSGSGKTLLCGEFGEFVKAIDTSNATLYVEVRKYIDLRDILLSISCGLVDYGLIQPFISATKKNVSKEDYIRNVAQEIGVSTSSIYIILDFVEGACSSAFVNDFRIFLETFSSETVHFIVFGQNSIFHSLSTLQREQLKIPEPIYMPGLDFEEFVTLTSNYYHDLERNFLWDVFQNLTAGRSSGLPARLAVVIASGTYENMIHWSNFLPEDILWDADKKRYGNIPERMRLAAQKIICFLLPFTESEASMIFPHEPIRETIREMVSCGLLRFHDRFRLEMHESIRAGLENIVPVDIRKETHDLLANYYINKNDIVTGILHKERGGKVNEANQIAKDYFMRGEHWESLINYIANNRVISGTELIGFLEAKNSSHKFYLLPRLFEMDGSLNVSQKLFQLVQKQKERFNVDYQWAWVIVESILSCNLEMLYDLINFGIQEFKLGRKESLKNIIFGSRRKKYIVSDQFLGMFEQQPDDIKVQLLLILLRDNRRKILVPALEFLYNYKNLENLEGRDLVNQLNFTQSQDIVEFIAAIPALKSPNDIIMSRSVVFGNLGDIIWKNRWILPPVCRTLLLENKEEKTTLENSLRVLAFLNDSDILNLAEKFIGQQNRLSAVAGFVLSLVPSFVDKDLYRSKLFNTNLSFEERFSSLYILLSIGVDAEECFNQLLSVINDNVDWKPIFFMLCIQYPFKSAISIFNEMVDDEKYRRLLIPLIPKIGNIEGEEVTDFLIHLLSSSITDFRWQSCCSLQLKRNPRALAELLQVCYKEKDKKTHLRALVAAISSKPKNFEDFNDVWENNPETAIWRCILAGRLRVNTEIPSLKKIAIDCQEHWQVRRSAILAITQMRSITAIEEIAEYIFKEKFTFYLDKDLSLLGHNILSSIILSVTPQLLGHNLREKDECRKIFAETFDMIRNKAIFSCGTPSGQEVSKWLFDEIERYGWPQNISGVDTIYNLLHLPILYAAVLRGLRICGNLKKVEEIIATTDHLWICARALSEWLKQSNLSEEDFEKIEKIVMSSSFGINVGIQNIIKNSRMRLSRNSIPIRRTSEIKYKKVTFDIIKQALNDGNLEIEKILIVSDLNEKQFVELVKELSPVNDYEQSWISSEPQISFMDKGGYSVNGLKSLSIEKKAKIRSTLRPGVFAANSFNLQVPWHQTLLGSERYETNSYSRKVLAVLRANNDFVKFYNEIDKYGDIYLSQFMNYETCEMVSGLVDQRIIPFLNRWLFAGKSEFLQALCQLASYINDESIDSILHTLFNRWLDLVFNRQKENKEIEDYLWKSFRVLTEHSRFKQIPDYDIRLSSLLSCNLPVFFKREIITLLLNSPRMYSKMEMLLFKAAPFEHFHKDEVDILDEAAQLLF